MSKDLLPPLPNLPTVRLGARLPAPNMPGASGIQTANTVMNVISLAIQGVNFFSDTIRELQRSDNETLRELGALLRPIGEILEFIQNRLQALRELLLRAAGPIVNILRNGERYQQADHDLRDGQDELAALAQELNLVPEPAPEENGGDQYQF